MSTLLHLLRDEDGATMVEYGLMVALIAVVCIVAVTAIGTNLSTLFSTVGGSL
ncbi:MAG: Flp family type IVb pilin [Vulcanimicrobiaceae bacterium]